MPVKAMQRQTHHIIIVTAYAFHSDIPYPFLDAVGPALSSGR